MVDFCFPEEGDVCEITSSTIELFKLNRYKGSAGGIKKLPPRRIRTIGIVPKVQPTQQSTNITTMVVPFAPPTA
jgi:hypothetical protein